MEGLAGRIINGAFAVWGRNLVSFSVLAVMIHIPVVAVQFALAGQFDASDPSAVMTRSFILVALNLTVGALLSAALTWGVLEDLRDRRASFADCLANGFSRMGPVLVVTLVATLATMVATMALVIPGIVVAMMLYIAVPAVVMEEVPAMEALRRSAQLTEGSKWSLLAVAFGLLIVTVTLAWGGGYVIGTVVKEPTTAALLGEVLAALFAPLQAAAAAVAYFLLRQEREGVHLDELASIFD